MSFNPNEHMMKLKGRDYLQVMWRLVWFREEKPGWMIRTEIVSADDKHAVFRATIADESGAVRSMGHGSESVKDFGDYLEKAETKAVGRALAMLGYGTQFAPELDEGERIVDSPVQREEAQQKAPAQPEPASAAQQKAPAQPEPASAAQIEVLRQMLTPEQWAKMAEKYGAKLEHLTKEAAGKALTKLKEMQKA